MTKVKLLAAALVVTCLAAATLGWWTFAGQQETTEASPTLGIGMDADPSGNGATSLGSVDSCVSVSSDTTFDIDLFVTDVAELLAWDIYFTFDPSVVNVVGRDVNMFLAANAGSQDPVFDLSDALPDSSGRYRAAAADIECIPETPGPCESGSGVLARLTLEAVGPGLSPAAIPLYLGLGLGPTLVDVEGQRLGDVNGDELFDGPVSNAWIAVDQECPSEPPPPPTPWPTPSPTATPSPTPTATPTVPPDTPTPTPPLGTVNLRSGWNDSCYVGDTQSIEGALAGVLDDILAVYRLSDQGFDRWFPNRPDVNTIATVNPYDQLFILATREATWVHQPLQTPPASVSLVSGWNSVCYMGQLKDVAAATANIAGQFGIVYTLAPDQTWRRFIPGRPEVSNLAWLEPATSVLMLVTAQDDVLWVFDP